jgi:hypothetical protein
MEALVNEREAVGLNAKELRLYNDLKAAGVNLDSERGQVIKANVEALFQEQAATEAVAEAQKKALEAAKEFSDITKDALGGFIKDLQDGKSMAEALANALESVADRLLDMSLDALFQVPTPATAQSPGTSGGLFGGLFGLLFSGLGGGVAPLNLLPSFHTGRLSNREYMAVLEDSEDVVTREQRSREAGVMASLSGMVEGARSSGGDGLRQITVKVEGARGNREIESMVHRGVAAGIGEYDRKIAPGRIAKEVQNGRRKGTIR